MPRIALIQHQCDATPEHNLDKILSRLQQVAEQGAQIVLLQELHNSLYFCQQEHPRYFDLAETIPGPSTETLGKIAREHNMVIVSSLFEKRAPGLYHNTAVVLDADGSIAGEYRKMHIPDDPGYYEKYYFTPGDLGFNPIQTRYGKLGVLVCWDQWYPEAARIMALKGADILLYPTAIGYEPSDSDTEKQRQRQAWINIQLSHAIANNLPLASCNRTGTESDAGNNINFWGSSFICDQQGDILSQAEIAAEQILYADIDFKHTETVRRAWPYLRDRRIDAYNDLLKRYCDGAIED